MALKDVVQRLGISAQSALSRMDKGRELLNIDGLGIKALALNRE